MSEYFYHKTTYERQWGTIHMLLGQSIYLLDVDGSETAETYDDRRFSDRNNNFVKLFEWELKYFIPQKQYKIRPQQYNYNILGELYPTVACICSIYDGCDEDTVCEPGFYIAPLNVNKEQWQWMSPLRLSKWLHFIRGKNWNKDEKVSQNNIRLLNDRAFDNVKTLGDLPNASTEMLNDLYGIPQITVIR